MNYIIGGPIEDVVVTVSLCVETRSMQYKTNTFTGQTLIAQGHGKGEAQHDVQYHL